MRDVKPFHIHITRRTDMNIACTFDPDAIRSHFNGVAVLIRHLQSLAGIGQQQGVSCRSFDAHRWFVIIENKFQFFPCYDPFLLIFVICGNGRGFGTAVKHTHHHGIAGIVIDEPDQHFIAYVGPEHHSALIAGIGQQQPGPDALILRINNRDGYTDSFFTFRIALQLPDHPRLKTVDGDTRIRSSPSGSPSSCRTTPA